MIDHFQNSVIESDKDHATSWAEFVAKIRSVSADLKMRTTGTEQSQLAARLFHDVSILCDHVETIHAEVPELIADLRNRYPDKGKKTTSPEIDSDEVEMEKIQIQREQHDKSDIIQVVKAMFMWVDDPVERVKEKNSMS